MSPYHHSHAQRRGRAVSRLARAKYECSGPHPPTSQQTCLKENISYSPSPTEPAQSCYLHHMVIVMSVVVAVAIAAAIAAAEVVVALVVLMAADVVLVVVAVL